MAKIHIKGGSPLRLEFETDSGELLAVRLEPRKPNEDDNGNIVADPLESKRPKREYWVINEATNKKLQTHQEDGQNIFRETNPDKKTCEISYMEKERAFA